MTMLSAEIADSDVLAQWQPNYDEAKVPDYRLPSLLCFENGSMVASFAQWDLRRRELIGLFQEYVYGRAPNVEWKLSLHRQGHVEKALGGLARREEWVLRVSCGQRRQDLHLLVYLPRQEQSAPVFLGMNFYGNQTITSEPDVLLSEAWMRQNDAMGIVDHRATEASRGRRSDRWPLEMILRRGWGLATLYCGDVALDNRIKWREGLPALLGPAARGWDADRDWGAIGAWAWGLSRALDALHEIPGVDPRRVAVFGHSRLGKAALWAAAQDERFAMAASNGSGCMGAALSRRCYGETIGRITRRYPYWFCEKLADFAGREQDLPVDQHQLLALIAPRPLLVSSGSEDLWADPRGEFLAVQSAAPAWLQFGLRAVSPEENWPAPGERLFAGYQVYQLHDGGHGLTQWDWQGFLDHAEYCLGLAGGEESP